MSFENFNQEVSPEGKQELALRDSIEAGVRAKMFTPGVDDEKMIDWMSENSGRLSMAIDLLMSEYSNLGFLWENNEEGVLEMVQDKIHELQTGDSADGYQKAA